MVHDHVDYYSSQLFWIGWDAWTTLDCCVICAALYAIGLSEQVRCGANRDQSWMEAIGLECCRQPE